MTCNILGISAYYHDSAAALLSDGRLIAAAQEERFTRKKHDAGFPYHAVKYCLEAGGLSLADIDSVIFYDKPLIKFERLLETYLGFAPKGWNSFAAAMPIWLKDKLYLKQTLRRELAALALITKDKLPKLLFAEHHQSHAASAFFPSPFDEAAVLCLDGVGEWATSSAWVGQGSDLRCLWEIRFPHSLGLLYSAFTYFTGFKVNSGEYKLMGLAPYGRPIYADRIREKLVDVKEDGTFRLDMNYFDFATGLHMTGRRFERLFGGPPRTAESRLTQREMDLAASIQLVTEEIVLKLARTLHRETGKRFLCLAGGVALNCVANGRVLRECPFEDVWVQPAAGDAGGAVGSAYIAWHEHFGGKRILNGNQDGMQGSYLGPRFANAEIETALDKLGATFTRIEDFELLPRVARLIESGHVVGWFSGRMEFGPRALGARSILGDPRSPKMQTVMNMKIKYRESFRPFAPSVLENRVSEYFDLDRASPYMQIVASVRENLRLPVLPEEKSLVGIDSLKVKRSVLPAVTHVDYSARIQTVHAETNPRFFRLLQEFELVSGYGVLINTSFNVRGEPIVCTPEDAYRCFLRTEIDVLVLENCFLEKTKQKVRPKDNSWTTEFALD